MRFDLQGFFWQDTPPERGQRSTSARPMPPIPQSKWKPPTHFPDLSAAKIIAVDVETYDPNLMQRGPGWATGDGEIVGVSLAVDRNNSWYFPIGHTVQAEYNMDREQVFSYLRKTLGTDTAKVGANLQYDVGWLKHHGVPVGGMLYDVQYAEALIDDVSRSYALEVIAKKYLGHGKESEELYEWCAKAYGGNANPKQRANIYRAPCTLVGPYAQADAWEPIEILTKQWAELSRMGLLELFHLECRLIRPLVEMRFRGLHVDMERVEQVREYLLNKEQAAQQQLDDFAGFHVGVHKNADLKRLFDAANIRYPTTARGNASFTDAFLSANSSKPAKLIQQVRKYNKNRIAFVENGCIDKQVDGVVHPSFHPLRGERGGAVSGRFSSSDPNAQQTPSRDKELAPLIRGMYIPEPHYTGWIKLDLSQIEYRLFAHYSQDQHLIDTYEDPNTDYHATVSGFLGDKMPRGIVKNFNFMSLYGGGRKKTKRMIEASLTKAEIEELCLSFGLEYSAGNMASVLGDYFVDLYAEKFPAAQDTMQRVIQEVNNTGEVRTILNRRRSFDLWEPVGARGMKPLPYNAAVKVYGTYLQRAGAYKGLNAKLQGSAADLIKLGLVNAYEAGLLRPDRLGAPYVTVHDEFDFGFHEDLRGDFIQFKECIEDAIKLKVPVVMDADVGPDWGHVQPYDLHTGKFKEKKK